jgi:hypothetical protein
MRDIKLAAAGRTALPGLPRQIRRVMLVAVRRISRLSPLRTDLPEWVIRGDPRPAYDAARARDLLAGTAEFPCSRSGTLAALHEYRYALHDILAAVPNAEEPATSPASRE